MLILNTNTWQSISEKKNISFLDVHFEVLKICSDNYDIRSMYLIQFSEIFKHSNPFGISSFRINTVNSTKMIEIAKVDIVNIKLLYLNINVEFNRVEIKYEPNVTMLPGDFR